MKTAVILIIFCLPIYGCASGAYFKKTRIDEPTGKEIRPENIVIQEPQPQLTEGEKFTYTAQWLGLTVGRITVYMKSTRELGGRDVYKAVFNARTAGFMAAIYSVDDTFTSYIDKKTLLPIRHTVKRREGRHHIKDYAVDFERSKGIAIYTDFAKGGPKEEVPIPPDCFDILSALYYFRSRNVTSGDRISVSVNMNKKNYRVGGLIGEKRIIQLRRIGTFDAFLFIPYAILRGEPVRKGRVEAYISADNRRLPLYIIIKGPIFTRVTIVLKSQVQGHAGSG